MVQFLLPFDAVRDFLSQSPAVIYTSVSVALVYDAIIEILTALETQKIEQKRGNPQTNDKPTTERCTSCLTGYMQLNTKEAEKVCTNCGTVHEVRMILRDNCQTFDERYDDMLRHSRSTPNDVPKWVQKALDYDSEERHRMEIENELEHYNAIPHLKDQKLRPDEMMRAKRNAMLPSRANPSTRVVAAMLVPKVEKFLEDHDVRQAITAGRSLPTMRFTPRESPYKCIRCGAAVDEPYLQRRHPCGWGKKKRKQSFP